MKKLLFILVLLPLNLYAIDKNPVEFTTPAQEALYQELINKLRCVVCQNQSLADSNAELAQDLREQVRQMILNGQGEIQVTDFLVSRYGDFVLYDPPLSSKTYLLWLGPFLLYIVALMAIFYFIRRHAKTTQHTSQLSTEDQQKLTQLLEEQGK